MMSPLEKLLILGFSHLLLILYTFRLLNLVWLLPAGFVLSGFLSGITGKTPLNKNIDFD